MRVQGYYSSKQNPLKFTSDFNHIYLLAIVKVSPISDESADGHSHARLGVPAFGLALVNDLKQTRRRKNPKQEATCTFMQLPVLKMRKTGGFWSLTC